MTEALPRDGAAADLTRSGAGTLLFMHIPKTAGTFIRRTVEKAYARDERVFLYQPQHVRGAVLPARFADLPESRRRDLRLVLGHFGYGLHEAVPRDFAYVTVLRDPVDRVLSLYSHHTRPRGRLHKLLRPGLRDGSPASRERELIEASGLTLEQWVFERQPLPADNAYARTISGQRDVAFGACSEVMLAAANDHIDRNFAGLLVSEDMGRSLEVLAKMMGRPLRPARRRNVNRGRAPIEAIDPELRWRIAQLNRFDVELHRLATERFDELWRRYRP